MILSIAKAIDNCLNNYQLPEEVATANSLRQRVIQALKISAAPPSLPHTSGQSSQNDTTGTYTSSSSQSRSQPARRTWANVVASDSAGHTTSGYTTETSSESRGR